MSEPKAQDVRVVEKKPLSNGFFKLDAYVLRVPHYDGTLGEPICREVADRGDAAGVLLFDPDADALVFVEQFRPGTFIAKAEPWMLECVAGIIEPGETGESVVTREAMEEAGCTVSDVMPIASYYSSPGGMTERIDLFCGRVDSSCHADIAGLAGEGEDIRVRVLSSDEVIRKTLAGEINNALTLIACQWFVMNKENLLKKWGKK